MEAAGFDPAVQLLERCLERAEREGDTSAIARVTDALELQAYKIIGAASKVRAARHVRTIQGFRQAGGEALVEVQVVGLREHRWHKLG